MSGSLVYRTHLHTYVRTRSYVWHLNSGNCRRKEWTNEYKGLNSIFRALSFGLRLVAACMPPACLPVCLPACLPARGHLFLYYLHILVGARLVHERKSSNWGFMNLIMFHTRSSSPSFSGDKIPILALAPILLLHYYCDDDVFNGAKGTCFSLILYQPSLFMVGSYVPLSVLKTLKLRTWKLFKGWKWHVSHSDFQ